MILTCPQLHLLLVFLSWASGCGPGRGSMRRRPGEKLSPLVFKQHVPNVSENTLGASGLKEKRITRADENFKDLVPNYNNDIIFRDEEGTGADRLMTQRCMEKLNTLAISVMNQWPGVKLRVTEAWDEGNYRSRDSLHYEGRAVDITTSDRDRSKYGMLARLAVEAGFDWVYYESRAHIHCSVKSESSQAVKSGGCFTGNSTVLLENGARRTLNELEIGEKVMTYDPQTGKMEYSEVIMFLDRDPSEKTKFVSLVLSSGKELRVTPQHLVWRKTKSGSEAVFAARLEPGDLLYFKTETGRVTTSVLIDSSFVADEGVIAPLTRTGTIIVNDVVASCYAVIESQTVAHASFIPYRIYNNVANSVSSIIHSSRSHKLPTGVPWYPKVLYFLSSHLLPDNLIYK